jgi:hypothetical protein
VCVRKAILDLVRGYITLPHDVLLTYMQSLFGSYTDSDDLAAGRPRSSSFARSASAARGRDPIEMRLEVRERAQTAFASARGILKVRPNGRSDQLRERLATIDEEIGRMRCDKTCADGHTTCKR